MTNPFVKPPSVDKRLMTPRTALVPSPTVPAGEALDNWQPEELVDGALCFVLSEAAIYQFDKFSASAPSGNTVIATIKGTSVRGRWLLLALGAAEKAYRALSYAYPNAVGPTSNNLAQALFINTWTPFSYSASSLAVNGDLSFDADKAIVADRAMTVQIDWYLSWVSTSVGPFLYEGACLLNGTTTPVPGSKCRDYYVPEASNQNQSSVMTATTIATLAQGDTLEIMVKSIDAVVEGTSLNITEGQLVVMEL